MEYSLCDAKMYNDRLNAAFQSLGYLPDGEPPEAKERVIVNRFRRFIHRTAIVNRKCVPFITDDDLESAGYFALAEAMRRYDPDKGPFYPFAQRRITGAIIDEFRKELKHMGLTRRTGEIMNHISELEAELCRAPTFEELERHLSYKKPGVNELQTMAVAMTSYYSTCRVLFDGAPVTVLRDPSDDLNRSIDYREKLVAAMAALPKRERDVIMLYYFQDLNLQEIGDALGVNESRVWQLRKHALGKLKETLK